MAVLIDGALAMSCAIAGLCFFRFWTTTRDRLFVFFGLAFCVLGAHWLTVGLLRVASERVYYLYLPRLVAFLLIITGIIMKNREGR